jgi:serine protease AprX
METGGTTTMSPTRGLSWDDSKSKTIALLASLALILSVFAAGFAPASASTIASEDVNVVIREIDPATSTAETLVEKLGGVVKDQLAIIGGFTATIPASALGLLEANPAISAATPDGNVTLTFEQWGDGAADLTGYNDKEYGGSLYRIAETTGAKDLWSSGITGAGIDVALIDSGVAPVSGLTAPGKVINGPDLSFESQNPDFRYLDTFGHGTHMAGIIAGSDVAGPGYADAMEEHFVGIAPEARIVSLKVADHEGATDVSQVIAAIDWVVQHKNDNGLNIRVLNLSFGTDSTQSYLLDPLAYAVEQAWNAGIVVVVAAGNDGNGNALRNPAHDPVVIAVGSHEGNKVTGAKAELVSDFANCGTNDRSIDLLARGRSVASLRSPGSSADDANPEAVVANRLFLGSGTSQSAAVVSGGAALLLSARPELTPDQVKALLIENGQDVKRASGLCDAPAIDLKSAAAAPTPNVDSAETGSTGTGSLEASRGTDHLEHDGVVLEGEQDIFGNEWDGVSWSTAAAQGTSWSGGDWNGVSWSGVSWSGVSWSGVSWSGVSWSGVSWSGVSWSGTSWSDKYWNGVSWSGTSWSGTSWSGTSWSGTSWSGASWR